MNAATRRVLLLCRASPAGGPRVRDALDAAMAFGAFEQQVTLLLLGDGVLAALDGQQAPAGARTAGKLIGALPDHDAGHAVVSASALAARGLQSAPLLPGIECLDDDGIAVLVASHDIVLSV